MKIIALVLFIIASTAAAQETSLDKNALAGSYGLSQSDEFSFENSLNTEVYKRRYTEKNKKMKTKLDGDVGTDTDADSATYHLPTLRHPSPQKTPAASLGFDRRTIQTNMTADSPNAPSFFANQSDLSYGDLHTSKQQTFSHKNFTMSSFMKPRTGSPMLGIAKPPSTLRRVEPRDQ